MTRIACVIKTPFGEIKVVGESTEEILDVLQGLDPDFIKEVNERALKILISHSKNALKGIVEVGRDGPIIVTKKKLSHYEAIGLVLYSMRNQQSSSRDISKRLSVSGKKVTVPARLHEMRKRGHIFKPIDKSPYYKLSIKGVNWIEEEVLPSLKKN